MLTAHHCVSRRDENLNVLNEDVDSSELRVELGGDDLPWGEVGVHSVVTAECGYQQGMGDVAILVLNGRSSSACRPSYPSSPRSQSPRPRSRRGASGAAR